MVCYDMNTHTVNMSLTTESDCQAAGLMWTAANSGPSGDDHSDEEEHHEVGAVVIHIEAEGDYGFALPKDVEMFVMMGEGGHEDHDDHGHGAGPFEWAGMFEMNDATHTWSMQKVNGDYADPTMRLVLIPTDTATEENMHSLESGVEALIEGDCTVVEDGETMTSIAATGSCFELHVGTGDDSLFTIDTSGISGMAMYAQHVPTEFERDAHYLKDSAGTDIEPIAQEGAGAHDDHSDHGDDHGDEHGDEDSNSTIVAEEGESFTYDPHSWLDPVAFEAQLNVVLEKLILTFPEGASDFTANADSYKAQLQTLDNDYENAFGEGGTCVVGGHDKTIVANHNAYSYISVRYDIDIITVHGLDPEGEPSPQDIIKVTQAINEKGITVLFVEEYTNQNAINSIVEDTGVSIEILYTMEMAPSDVNDDYLSMMNKNLNNLVDGIGC
ncbi:MAG: metal ABC transporter substrate-binding protein, partial [Candidatus Thalassarchaeaceae archaeon]